MTSLVGHLETEDPSETRWCIAEVCSPPQSPSKCFRGLPALSLTSPHFEVTPSEMGRLNTLTRTRSSRIVVREKNYRRLLSPHSKHRFLFSTECRTTLKQILRTGVKMPSLFFFVCVAMPAESLMPILCGGPTVLFLEVTRGGLSIVASGRSSRRAKKSLRIFPRFSPSKRLPKIQMTGGTRRWRPTG